VTFTLRVNFSASMTMPSTPGRHLEGVVLHVLAGASEDRVEQLLLGGELALRLRRDLADEHVAGLDARADADDARLVEDSRSAFSLTFGMSRVNSSRPSFVSRISISNSSMWIEVYMSRRRSPADTMIASSKL
jgi:hypothetical protein